MRFFKYIEGGYIISIGKGYDGIEISETEYNNILDVIKSKPTAPVGFDYRLCVDLTWELYELPPEPEIEPTSEDYEQALNRLGVET